MRIGQGIDAHKFGGDGPIVIGGVSIAHEKGLLAHSDGDVLIHAVCDALLGAAGLGDIGTHFPDSDHAYKNADSRVLLRQVVAQLSAKELAVGNLDTTIVAQTPRMNAHIVAMIANLAGDLGVDATQVNVKATTTERMGFTGREEGIAAFAVVFLRTV